MTDDCGTAGKTSLRTHPGCGYDGNPPRFLPVRDLAGQGKRKLAGVYNAATDHIGLLESRQRISPEQLQAGRRLQADWQLAQIGGYSAIHSLTGARTGGLGMSGLPDSKLDAQARHGAAMRLLGPSGRLIVELIVLGRDNQPPCSLAKAEAIMRLPVGGAIGALRVALDVLAAHYGIG